MLRKLFASIALVLLTSASAGAQNHFGINAHIPTDAELDLVARSGATWVRVDCDWQSFEPRRGDRRFMVMDRVVNSAVARGLRVFMTIAYTPTWASIGNGDARTNNDVPRPEAYAAFVEATVARYADRVQHFGLWNEPNLVQFFEGDVDQYIDNVLQQHTPDQVRELVQAAPNDLARRFKNMHHKLSPSHRVHHIVGCNVFLCVAFHG